MTENKTFVSRRIGNLIDEIFINPNDPRSVDEKLRQILNPPDESYHMLALQVINDQFYQMIKESKNDTRGKKLKDHLESVHSIFKMNQVRTSISNHSKNSSLKTIGVVELCAQPDRSIRTLLVEIADEIEKYKNSTEALGEEIVVFLTKLQWIVTNYQYLGSGVGSAFFKIVTEYENSSSIPKNLWNLLKTVHSTLMPIAFYIHLGLGAYADASATSQAQLEGTGVEKTLPEVVEKIIEGEEIKK